MITEGTDLNMLKDKTRIHYLEIKDNDKWSEFKPLDRCLIEINRFYKRQD